MGAMKVVALLRNAIRSVTGILEDSLWEALGWVTTPETRCEYVHVRSSQTSLFVKVSGVVPHPKASHKESSRIPVTDLIAFLNRATTFIAPKKNPPRITN